MQPRFSDEEPSVRRQSASGSGGRPYQPEFNIRQRNGPKLLRAVAKKHDIVCTKSLVAAYNATTDENERAVLLDWLCKYAEGSKDCSKPKAVLEYAELAKVVHVTEQDAEVLRKLVYGLGSLTRPGEFLDMDVSKSLFSALTWVDSSVYDDTAQLTHLAYNLVSALSRWPRLTKQNFLKYEVNFLCIHQVFFLLQSIGRGCLLEKEKKEFRQAITQKRDEMEISNLYYPVSFHFELIQQAIERLEIEDAPSPLSQAKRYTVSGLYGGIHVFHFLRKLAGGDIDPTSIEDAYKRGRAAIANAGVSEREWYDILQILTAARICCLKQEKKCEIFSLACDAAMEGQRKTGRENEQKPLRFGIVQEMKLLASDRDSSYDGRKEGTKKLVDLAKNQAISENWIHDADILTAILDALQMIHTTGEENQETVEAVLKIQRSCDGRAKETFTLWLDGNTIEEKLRLQHHEHTDNKHVDLFAKTGVSVGYLHLSTVRSNIEDLKKKYLHDSFATVPSLFEPDVQRHVKSMEHHVVVHEEIIEKIKIEKSGERHKERQEEKEGESSTIHKKDDPKQYYEQKRKVATPFSIQDLLKLRSLEAGVDKKEIRSSAIRERDDPKEYYEQKRKVATPISIEDLFKPRSLEAGVDKREIRRVLLYGNPGSGKTCISKAIAHKWALGAMWQELKAIYVVPVRRLNVAKAKGIRGEALEEVISQMCFNQKGSDVEFEELKTQVGDDLEMSSTLLVFDGLDEADDDARDLLSEAEKGECKLLVLTRPYNLRGIQKRVDCHFECLGFNDEQLRNYIRSELSEDEAPRLIRSLENTTAMWEMAHIPVTAHILCSLSKEHGGAIEEEGKRASTFQIYNDMANYVWKRFEKKPTARNIQREELFKDLEKIAFESLRGGLILIHERFVMQHATSKNAVRTFKESGFFLLVLEGQEYQFPHLTYQEYFAGRYIARILKQRGSDAEMRVLDFIRDGKYDAKRALTLTFAMHAFAVGRGKQALEELLSIMDEQPVEVLGIQHFFLRMRVLEATLEEADEDEIKALAKDENTTALVKSASQLLESTIDHVLIREIVVEEFKRSPRILERFPQVLDDTVDEVKHMLAYLTYITWKEMEKITNVLKLVRHSPKHSNGVTQVVLQMAKHGGSWCDSHERIRRLASLATHVPQHGGELLPMLAKMCSDQDVDVSQAATDAIGRFITAAPQHVGDFLSTLAAGCRDDDSNVRRVALEAIGRVVTAAPRHVDELLLTLAAGCRDDELNVRRVALETIGRVVTAAPQHVDELLSTLAAGCRDDDSNVRRVALEAIGPVVTAAPQHVDELLPTLAAGCRDDDSAVRRVALVTIGRVVTAAPQHVDELLPTLAAGCRDDDSAVRRVALVTIGRVVTAAPQHVDELLPTLAAGCRDDDSAVRRVALVTIGRVVTAAPQHVDELLPTLAAGCRDDDDSTVRRVALEAIGRVVAAAPQHANEYLPLLVRGCDDESVEVRREATEAIGRVVAAAPQHANEYLPLLVRGCDDESVEVRREATEAIGRVVAAAPQHANEYLPLLVRGCDDEDEDVRQRALEAIGRVVAAAPQHANEYLPLLVRGCDDESVEVRREATEAIGRVVAATPRLAIEHLPTLARLYKIDWSVRPNTLKAIGRVIAAAPQQANEHLLMLAKRCSDEDEDVRRAATEVVGSAVEAVPRLATEHLPTLAKRCSDEDEDVRREATEAIGRIVSAAPQYGSEHLQTLAILFSDDSNVSPAALEAICLVAEAAPRLANEHLPTLSRLYEKVDWSVHSDALNAIGRIIATAPHHAGVLLPTLSRLYDKVDWSVRRAAMLAIGCVVSVASQYGGKYLPMLARGYGDNQWRVRAAALETIGRVVTAAPQHVDELLPTLAAGCRDDDSNVRRVALETIGRVVTAALQHVGELLPKPTMLCGDKDWSVRRAALEAIGRIVAAAPQHAAEHLQTVVILCGDRHWSVRQAALDAIGRIVAAAPQHAGVLLPTLVNGCHDQRINVRNAARKALESVKLEKSIYSAIPIPSIKMGSFLLFFVQNSFTLDLPTDPKPVSFVLHTTSSQAIGEWDKEVIDMFIGRVRQECDEEFPRLLENIITKE